MKNVTSACWMSNGVSIGSPVSVIYTDNSYSSNSGAVIGTGTDINSGDVIWGPYIPTITAPPIPNSTPPPWNTPPNSTPPPWNIPPYTYIPYPTIDVDEEGNKVIQSTAPTLEQVLVEIAKVLRDRGDILEVREIFERYKLKLVDHDGEIIFDPSDTKKLENKSF